MNYIWELAIKAKRQGIDVNEIFFRKGDCFSAYLELSFESINETSISKEVEINPYYRYYSIFKELFHPDMEENPQIALVIHNMVVQHLINVDVCMGLSRKEYYMHFLIRDMNEGYFGKYVKDKLKSFTNEEQMILANNILDLYITGESIYLLKDTVRKIFTSTYIFSNAEEKDEIIFFLRTARTEKKEDKLSVIKYIFLSFKYTVEIYWEQMFGIIGVDELMKIDEIVNY